MNDMTTISSAATHKIISGLFVIIFFALGILNLIFVHYVPGIIYILLSFVYLPSINTFLKNRFGFTIPLWTKILVGLLILWATLGVGDLMEIFESWLIE